MLPYYHTAASTMYTLKCTVYITAPKTEFQFSFLLGPIPLPFFLKICDWLIQERLSFTSSLNMLLPCVIKTCSALEILKLVESSGNSGRWHPLLVQTLSSFSAQSSAKRMLPLWSVYCEKTKKMQHMMDASHSSPFFHFTVTKLLPLQQILSTQFINNSWIVFELLTSAKL